MHWTVILGFICGILPLLAMAAYSAGGANTIDREERPDIDQMYMAATQAMTGSGGWPMSVFLLPDGSPFYAGTYFPPTASSGRPGFKDLLKAIRKAWQENRKDIQDGAQRLVAAIESHSTPAGGYYSAEDADSENPYKPGEYGEGTYYLWRADEIVDLLGRDEGALFINHFGVKEEGNASQDPMQEFAGRNILYKSSADYASKEPAKEIKAILDRTREKLLAARQLRSRPHLDDKVITSWNGMVLGALAKSSRILDDPKLLDEAVRTASFIREFLYDDESGSLQRSFRRQKGRLPGQLDDYANLVAGLLELYLASHDPQWLRWAVTLTHKQINLFWSETDGFFYDSTPDPTVKIRMRSRHDGAEPAGNSVAAMNLLKLGHLRNKSQWLDMAGRLMGSYSETLNNHPTSLPLMLTARLQPGWKTSQIIIAGQQGARETNALLQVAYSSPTSLTLLADGGENQSYLAEKLPFLDNVMPIDNRATAYVCRDFTCRLPVTDPDHLRIQAREQVEQ